MLVRESNSTKSKEIACGFISEAEISHFVDGGLPMSRESEIESHMSECAICAERISAEKIFLGAIRSSLEGDAEVPVPKDFTRIVVAQAENRVGGLRNPREFTIASLIVAAVLGLLVFLVASGKGELGPGLFVSAVEKFVAVLAAVAHLMFSFSLSLSVVVRSLTADMHLGQTGASFLIVMAAVLFLLFCLRIRSRRSGNL